MTLIRADGTERDVEGRLTFESLQFLVGGYVQDVALPDGRHMFMDEDGKLKRKTLNQKATLLWHPHHDTVVGDVLVLDEREYTRFRQEADVHPFPKRS